MAVGLSPALFNLALVAAGVHFPRLGHVPPYLPPNGFFFGPPAFVVVFVGVVFLAVVGFLGFGGLLKGDTGRRVVCKGGFVVTVGCLV